MMKGPAPAGPSHEKGKTMNIIERTTFAAEFLKIKAALIAMQVRQLRELVARQT